MANKNPWNQSSKEILQAFEVSPEEGLSERQVKSRRKQHGKNLLKGKKPKSTWSILIDQFESPIMLLLAAAAALSLGLGETIDGIAIIVVIILTAAIGFFTEIRAVRSMEALREMSKSDATVRRNGNVKTITADFLVPGDIVILDSGDVVSADMRLIEANKLQADESALTGESLPVSKTADKLDGDLEIAEQKNMLFKGTAITNGSGMGVVTSIGMETELGKISRLVAEAEEEITPLEKRLDKLAHKLIWLTLSVAAAVAVIGIIRGRNLFLMVETAIALAVAAIPEGLPIVATVALARGMLRMAKRNALINKLASVETLGATNIIFTDKTGTLTENKMTVTRILTGTQEYKVAGEKTDTESETAFYTNDKPVNINENDLLQKIVRVGVLCNNASLNDEQEGIGDPLEVALLQLGLKAKIHRDDLLDELAEAREVAFQPDTKMMATYHETNGAYYLAVKGAPEAIIEHAAKIRTNNEEKKLDDKTKKSLLEKNEALAGRGLRMLAIAERTTESKDDDPYGNLTFLALIGLKDPPREEIPAAIKECVNAGIRVIMVTGDQANTAKNIAEQIKLTGDSEPKIMQGRELKNLGSLSDTERQQVLETAIFARVSPEQKLDMIDIHQNNNSIVAMTGDGVNDAPALKKADIGIAMGQRGTQVARESADMILKDDAFSSILIAVRFGRVIFNNIRKFVLFLLSGNVGEVVAVAVASAFGLPLPLLPLQILFINMILDVFPALALGVGEGESGVMKKPPRDADEPIMTRGHWRGIGLYGILIALTVLGALIIALKWFGYSDLRATTISFLTLGFARLWHVFNMRDRNSTLLKNDVIKNPFVWGAIVLCALLLISTVVFPWLGNVLKIEHPGPDGWFLVIGMSLIPFIIGQFYKFAASVFVRRN